MLQPKEWTDFISLPVNAIFSFGGSELYRKVGHATYRQLMCLGRHVRVWEFPDNKLVRFEKMSING